MILSLMRLDATLTAVDDNGDLQIYIICILQNCELSQPYSFICVQGWAKQDLWGLGADS
jgi:hypothetical protein